MQTAVRPAIAVGAATAVAIGSVIGVSTVMSGSNHIGAMATVSNEQVLLAGFIDDIYNQIQPVVAGIVDTAAAAIGAVPIVGPPVADQIDILYTYAQQAVGATVNWADDLVTPLATGQFWPVSGQPGNYVTGAINSTVVWGQSLINTAIGFAQAEIDYFSGWIPNLPGVITNIVNQVVSTIQQVINWITGFIPGPFAAVAKPAVAAASLTAARATVTKRSAVRPGASGAAAARPARAAAADKVAKHPRAAATRAAKSGR